MLTHFAVFDKTNNAWCVAYERPGRREFVAVEIDLPTEAIAKQEARRLNGEQRAKCTIPWPAEGTLYRPTPRGFYDDRDGLGL